MKFIRKVIPKNESAVRKAVSKSHNTSFKPLKNLTEARKYKDAYLVMEGDYGGQIYLVVQVNKIKCSYQNLRNLLKVIDKTCWNDESGTGIYFERLSVGDIISGGMGGGRVSKGLWIHKDIETLRDYIKKALKKSNLKNK